MELFQKFFGEDQRTPVDIDQPQMLGVLMSYSGKKSWQQHTALLQNNTLFLAAFSEYSKICKEAVPLGNATVTALGEVFLTETPGYYFKITSDSKKDDGFALHVIADSPSEMHSWCAAVEEHMRLRLQKSASIFHHELRREKLWCNKSGWVDAFFDDDSRPTKTTIRFKKKFMVLRGDGLVLYKYKPCIIPEHQISLSSAEVTRFKQQQPEALPTSPGIQEFLECAFQVVKKDDNNRKFILRGNSTELTEEWFLALALAKNEDNCPQEKSRVKLTSSKRKFAFRVETATRAMISKLGRGNNVDSNYNYNSSNSNNNNHNKNEVTAISPILATSDQLASDSASNLFDLCPSNAPIRVVYLQDCECEPVPKGRAKDFGISGRAGSNIILLCVAKPLYTPRGSTSSSTVSSVVTTTTTTTAIDANANSETREIQKLYVLPDPDNEEECQQWINAFMLASELDVLPTSTLSVAGYRAAMRKGWLRVRQQGIFGVGSTWRPLYAVLSGNSLFFFRSSRIKFRAKNRLPTGSFGQNNEDVDSSLPPDNPNDFVRALYNPKCLNLKLFNCLLLLLKEAAGWCSQFVSCGGVVALLHLLPTVSRATGRSAADDLLLGEVIQSVNVIMQVCEDAVGYLLNDPAKARLLVCGLGMPEPAVKSAALNVLAICCCESEEGHLLCLAALEYYVTWAKKESRFDVLIESLVEIPVIQFNAMHLINSLIDQAGELSAREGVRHEMLRLGLAEVVEQQRTVAMNRLSSKTDVFAIEEREALVSFAEMIEDFLESKNADWESIRDAMVSEPAILSEVLHSRVLSAAPPYNENFLLSLGLLLHLDDQQLQDALDSFCKKLLETIAETEEKKGSKILPNIVGATPSPKSIGKPLLHPYRGRTSLSSPRVTLTSFAEAGNTELSPISLVLTSPDAVSTNEISGVSSPISPPPPPPPPMMGGAPPPPPMGAPAVTRRVPTRPPKCKLKTLHWHKIPATKTKNTIWEKMTNHDKKIPMDDVENLFAATTVIPTAATSGRKTNKVLLLDMKKGQAVCIVLSRFKDSPETVGRALLTFDSSILKTGENVSALLPFLPGDDEWQRLSSFDGELNTLGAAEQCFKPLCTVERVKERLECFEFMLNYGTRIRTMTGLLETLEVASHEIRQSSGLNAALALILSMGNALNCGTFAGNADGFKLEALDRLVDIKTSDNKSTLLNFIVKLGASIDPKMLQLRQEILHTEAASRIEVDSIDEELQNLREGLAKLHEEEMLASGKDDYLHSALQSFRSVCVGGDEILEARLLTVRKLLSSTAHYFVESTTFSTSPLPEDASSAVSTKALFGPLHKLSLAIDRAVEENIREEQEAKEREKRIQRRTSMLKSRDSERTLLSSTGASTTNEMGEDTMLALDMTNNTIGTKNISNNNNDDVGGSIRVTPIAKKKKNNSSNNNNNKNGSPLVCKGEDVSFASVSMGEEDSSLMGYFVGVGSDTDDDDGGGRTDDDNDDDDDDSNEGVTQIIDVDDLDEQNSGSDDNNNNNDNNNNANTNGNEVNNNEKEQEQDDKIEQVVVEQEQEQQ